MAKEVELKLELSVEGSKALEASGLLPGCPASAIQHTAYFDTPDGFLAKAGFSLRIRESNGKRKQTVKGEGAIAAGLFVRSEWEHVTKSVTPLIDDRTPIKALLGERAGALVTLFDIQIERRTWTILHDQSEFELVLDRGMVISGDRQSPVCEVELELTRGDPAALFDFAKKMDAVAPIRIGVLSKSERGRRLRESAIVSQKAEKLKLERETMLPQAFQQIAGSCVRQFRLNESLIAWNNPSALHQARVGLRRLRSAISTFRQILADDRLAPIQEDLRWLSGVLGRARNLDVLVLRAEHYLFAEPLRTVAKAAYADVATALASQRARILLLDLAQWLAVGSWLNSPETSIARRDPTRDFAITQLERYRRRIKKNADNLVRLDDPGRHRIRKDAKKLRYCAGFFQSLFDENKQVRRYKRFIGALDRLLAELGTLNDVATGASLLAEMGMEPPGGSDELLADKHRDELIDRASNALEEFLDAKKFWRLA